MSQPFHNFHSKGRVNRQICKDPQTFEKKRLAARKEGFQRHLDQNNPIHVEESAAGYLCNSDRFHTDTTGEEHAKRVYDLQTKKQQIETLRTQRLDRENQRWKEVLDEKKKEDDRIEKLKGSLKKNNCSVNYDFVTLSAERFGEDVQKQFEYEKKLEHWRGAKRAERIYRQNNGKINPITGEPIQKPIQVPPQPTL